MKNTNYTVELTPKEMQIVRYAMRHRADNLFKHEEDKDIAKEICERLYFMAAQRINPDIF